MDDMVTEYDEYRTSSDAMRKNIDHSLALAEMFVAANGGENFDPVLMMGYHLIFGGNRAQFKISVSIR